LQVRLATEADLFHIKALHEKTGYNYPVSDIALLRGLHVVVSGKEILGAAGFERCAQVVMVVDSSLPPGYRMEVIKALHIPVANAVLEDESDRALVFIDTRFPSFGRRLEQLGWHKNLWPCYEINQEQVREKLNENL